MQNMQPSNLQMSYEQFQEQIRQKQERDQVLARQALQQAGADSRSEKLRTLVNQLQQIQSELKIAENQFQVQMDAQRRQMKTIFDIVSQMEHQLGGVLAQPPSVMQ
jgi:arylsulfatase A-like enzyme